MTMTIKPTKPTPKNVGFFSHKWLFITTSHGKSNILLKWDYYFLRIIGLVETIDYQIGFDENKIIGLVETINYQTPTNNPRLSTIIHKPTNEKINRAHVTNIKHSTRTQRKNKRGNTA